MGILICILVIFIIAAIVCYMLSEGYPGFLDSLSWVFGILAGITLFLTIIPNLFVLILKDQSIASETVDGQVLERLVQEDYNPENLNKALYFNAVQKKSFIYNKSFITRCWSNCYSVDTIYIPVEKFLPNTKHTLEVKENLN